jgi:ribokinase
MKHDVIVIGSATRDVFLNSATFKSIPDAEFANGQALAVPVGGKVEVQKIVFAIGGSGPDDAVTFARQGFKTACIGVIGNDINASAILQDLAAEGVDTTYFQKHTDDISAYSVILVQDSGERTILSYKGEGQHFEVAKIPFAELETDWLMIGSLGGHIDLFTEAVNWATSKGVKIATNPGTKELALGLDALRPLLKQCTVVSMNQDEACGLLGIDFKKEDEIFKAMDELVDGVFVMTKGPDGVVVSDGQHVYRAGVPDSPVVERTGAGDAFVSGFVSEYMRSGDIVKAIQLATANSSSVVTQYGAQAGVLKKGNIGPWPLVEVDVKNL